VCVSSVAFGLPLTALWRRDELFSEQLEQLGPIAIAIAIAVVILGIRRPAAMAARGLTRVAAAGIAGAR
jgi:hypothetical protein